jgi:hypothetical protein
MNSASFDEWGRMTANLGVEAPGATPLLQNIVLYPYVNPPTEILDSSSGDLPSSLNVTRISVATDGTQIWKLTHNGVDTHPIHFHLYDVQVLNRVTWDNIIIPPDPTELGWKETVRVSPLEDTIVAVRPIVPSLPFAVPDSYRPLNPAMPIGARGDLAGANALGYEAGFNNTDTAGNPMTTPIINTVENFDWEYVVHCHMLSHEEMDMMRPVTVHVARSLATAPVLSEVGTTNGFTWTDGTPVDYANPRTLGKVWGNPKAEIGYHFERADKTGTTVGAYSTIANVLANSTSYTDATAVAGKTYVYRVTAYNAAGDSRSNVLTVAYPAVKVTLSGVVTGAGSARSGVVVTAYTSAGVNVLSSTTNGSGTYTLSLNTGDYKLFITPNITGFANQWYKSTGNVPLQANAEVITIGANTTKNITLVGAPSFTLTGTVRLLTSSGTLMVGARVAAYNGTTSVTSGLTDANGVYSLVLPAISSPGGYKLYITPNKTGYANQWWGSSTGSGGSNGAATVVPFNANTTQNLIVHA